jgi:hypothetical protein
MRAVLTVLFTLVLVPPLARIGAPKETKGQHVTLTARCDPPVALPGGWVDVVIGCEIDPGWHTTSPRSKAGQRTLVDVTAPAGSVLVNRVSANSGEIVHDETFGDVEQISGRGEFRRRLHLPQNGEEGSRAIEGTVTIVVCDFAHCLPPQTLHIAPPLEVSAKNGLPGPQLGDELVLDKDEVAQLVGKGFFVRVSADASRVKPEEEFLLIVDIVLAAEMKSEGVSVTSVGDPKVTELGHAWTTSRKIVKGEGVGQVNGFSRVFPMRVAAGTTESKLKVPVAVQFSTKSAGGVMDFFVPLEIDH